MNDFYVWASLLVIVAGGFALAPWLRKTGKSLQNSLTNKNLIKQRLAELETEQQQALLTEEDKLQAQKELKLALLDEVQSQDPQQSSGRLPLLLGILICVGVGGATYFHASELDKVQHWQEVRQNTSTLGQRIIAADASLTFDDMRDFALGLRTRLIDEPNDPIGWMLLGRVSGALNRADSAIEAFERSIELEPNNVGTLTSYAQALLMVGQEAQLQTAERALSRVLSIEPDNVSALGMLAVVTSELGKFNASLTHWTRLQGFIGESDPNYAAVTEKIAQMRAALNQQEPATEAEPAGKTANQVEVTVSLSESLKDKLPSSGVIFVFAQGLSGSKMPAAVVKLPLADFPITVSLSDDNAMVQGYNLSQLTQARIVVRISADENVALATGELQGEQLIDFTLQSNPEVAITINKEEP